MDSNGCCYLEKTMSKGSILLDKCMQGWIMEHLLKPIGAKKGLLSLDWDSEPKRIYNPIMAIGFWEMFTIQLDNTKR